jgi:hypothetical protein
MRYRSEVVAAALVLACWVVDYWLEENSLQ